jgi:TRAP-type mannitol/chloroaromatic compound transport system permease small subunit
VRSLQGLAHAIDRLNEWIGVSVAWLALLTVLAEFTVVLMRYVFGVGSVKMQESIVYMHATVFMVAAGYTLLHNGHVRCDIFYAAAGPDRSDRGRRVPAADLRADRLDGMAVRRGGVGGA